MNISVFNQYFFPDTAATAQLLTDLCVGLGKTHEVSVICGAPSYNPSEPRQVKAPFKSEVFSGVKVTRVGSTTFTRAKMTGRLSNYLTYLALAPLAGRCNSKAQVALALTDPPPVGILAWCAARLQNIPMVWSIRDLHPDIGVQLGKINNRALIALIASTTRFVLKRADRIIVLGETMRQRVISKGAPPARVVVIPDWADTDAIVPKLKDNSVSRRRGLNDKFTVMYSGNIGLSQGLETFIETAYYLREHQDIRFVLVGDGAGKPKLEQLVEEKGLSNVRFFPYESKALLSESFACGDVHLVPLRRGLAGYIVPSKVYAVMASGRPFIAAVEDDCELVSMASEYGSGVVVPPDEPHPLVSTILELKQDPDRVLAMGQRAREAAVSQFSRRIGVERYDALLNKVVSERKCSAYNG